MRDLTKQQKKLLTEWLNEAEPKNMLKMLGSTNPIKSVDDLSIDQWEKLEKINDTEVLYNKVNAFIDDWRWDKIK